MINYLNDAIDIMIEQTLLENTKEIANFINKM
jgi:hypothetical protein